MKKYSKIFLILPFVFLQSCATFISKYSDFTKTENNDSEFPTMNAYLNENFIYKALISCNESINYCPPDADVFNKSDIIKAFQNNSKSLNIFYNTNGYKIEEHKCSEFTNCDLALNFEIVHKENSFLELISKLVTMGSLSIIPTPFFVKYEFNLIITDHNDKIIKKYSRIEKLTEWVHISFLFMPKTHNRFVDSQKILFDVVENILNQAKADGVIKKPAI